MTAETIEVKLRRRGKMKGWTKRSGEMTVEEISEWLYDILKKKGDEVAGYTVICKINGGYGKNHDHGSTISMSWKGRLTTIYTILSIPLPVGK